MIERDEETCSVNMRTFRRKTRDALRERKALTGKPVCRLADEIIAAYFENDTSTLEMRVEEVRRLAEEFGAK
jgi:hypothetical protein